MEFIMLPKLENQVFCVQSSVQFPFCFLTQTFTTSKCTESLCIEHIPQNELRSSESIGIYIFQLGSKLILSYIKYVTTGYNPQGCNNQLFKTLAFHPKPGLLHNVVQQKWRGWRKHMSIHTSICLFTYCN